MGIIDQRVKTSAGAVVVLSARAGDRVVELGLVMKSLDNFSMDDFEGRLILQKSVYLLQSFGIYRGYDFSWYIHGPYSPKLTNDGFLLREIYDMLPTGSFKSNTDRSKFARFLDFMKDKKKDPDRLEILASIHFLKNIDKHMSKKSILEKVEKKQPYFTKKQCVQGWNELERKELI